MSDPLLSVDRLSVRYYTEQGILHPLDDVSLTVGAAEIVGVVGESGCGKSTLATTLVRVLPPNAEIRSGRITLAGRDLLTLPEEQMREVRGTGLAMIFQDPTTSLNPTFRIGTQIVDAQRSHRGPGTPRKNELRTRTVDTLSQVGIPDAAERVESYPHEFSGGQRQRIVIGMALALQPALLIADEPTSALDVTLEAQILELLRSLRDTRGTSILFISHDLGVVTQICDRVIVMYAGRVVEQGSVFEIFEQPRHPYTQALLASVASRRHRGGRLPTIPGRVPMLGALPPGCKFAPRCARARASCEAAEPQLEGGVRCYFPGPVEARTGSANGARRAEIRKVARRAVSAQPGEPLVELSDVRTYYNARSSALTRFAGLERRAVRAVDGVDLTIIRGEVLGLVGESGSGKTTLAETILGLVPATSGEIRFDGTDVRRMRKGELRELRRHAQMIFQDPHASLSPRRRVEELLLEPYQINRVPQSERYSVEELLSIVGLSQELRFKYPHELSGGQARRVGIARALAPQPDLVIADEPTAGLDVSAAAAVLNLMRDLRDRLGLTYLVVTHNLSLVSYLADRVGVMYLGQLVEVGHTERVLESPAHPYTRALLTTTPELDPRRRTQRRQLLPGEIPSPTNPPSGCRFHTRCAFAEPRSKEDSPVLEEIEPGHFVACHFWRKVRAAGGADPVGSAHAQHPVREASSSGR